MSDYRQGRDYGSRRGGRRERDYDRRDRRSNNNNTTTTTTNNRRGGDRNRDRRSTRKRSPEKKRRRRRSPSRSESSSRSTHSGSPPKAPKKVVMEKGSNITCDIDGAETDVHVITLEAGKAKVAWFNGFLNMEQWISIAQITHVDGVEVNFKPKKKPAAVKPEEDKKESSPNNAE